MTDHPNGYFSICREEGTCVIVTAVVRPEVTIQIPVRFKTIIDLAGDSLYILSHRNQTSVPKDQRKRVLKRDNCICRDCGRVLKNYPQALDVHHIIMRRDGGPNEDWNLVTLCKTCHIVLHQKIVKANQRAHQRRRRKKCRSKNQSKKKN